MRPLRTAIFERRKIYEVPVRMSRHEALTAYIREVVQTRPAAGERRG
jgi:hypothetical protein